VAGLLHGQPLRDDTTYGIMMSSGLAKKLNVDTNANVVVTGPTVDGQMNALNAQIRCRADTADEMLSDKLILANLTFAQSLCNTKGADVLSILLADNDDTDGAKHELERLIAARGLDLSVATWEETSPAYTKVADMFNVIFSFLFVIVFVIVVLSVVNTVSMAVLERTREIGTLRALGLKRRGIVFMFATESAVLAFFGSVGGLALNFLTVGLVRFFEPKWVPPIMSRPIPLQVYIVPEYIAGALLSLMVLAVAAAIWPTRRATRMSIIDALGHV
jgi:putative ABC transport system permease protein